MARTLYRLLLDISLTDAIIQFYLHQRANHFQLLNINCLHTDPFLSNGLGEVLFLEPDLGLGFPFLVGDEGNITAVCRKNIS